MYHNLIIVRNQFLIRVFISRVGQRVNRDYSFLRDLIPTPVYLDIASSTTPREFDYKTRFSRFPKKIPLELTI
jgi:hypothetical protein